MGKDKLYQALGLPVDNDEIRTAQVVELKENEGNVPENPGPVAEPDSSKQELDGLNAKVAALEKKHNSNGKATGEQLQSAKEEITELRSNIADLQEQIVKAEATTAELEAANQGLAELQEKVATIEQHQPANPEREAVLEERVGNLENWKAEAEADKCPECGAAGFKNLAVQKEYGQSELEREGHIKGNECDLVGLLVKDDGKREVIAEFRQCECGYKEHIAGKEAEAEEAKAEAKANPEK